MVKMKHTEYQNKLRLYLIAKLLTFENIQIFSLGDSGIVSFRFLDVDTTDFCAWLKVYMDSQKIDGANYSEWDLEYCYQEESTSKQSDKQEYKCSSCERSGGSNKTKVSEMYFRYGSMCSQIFMQAINVENLIRVSLAIYNTPQDIDIFCHILLKSRKSMIAF